MMNKCVYMLIFTLINNALMIVCVLVMLQAVCSSFIFVIYFVIYLSYIYILRPNIWHHKLPHGYSAIPLLQGGTKRHRNPPIKVPIITLPAEIPLNHKDIELCIDLFYINIMPFLHKKSSKITCLTADNFISRSVEKLIQELHTVAEMYTKRGFNISVYHGKN